MRLFVWNKPTKPTTRLSEFSQDDKRKNMYSELEPNQNPDEAAKAQGGKSEPVEKAVKIEKGKAKASPKKQISAKEKKTISKALTISRQNLPEKKLSSKKVKTTKQINAKLKKSIISLLNDQIDNKLEADTKETVIKKKSKISTQISKSEKKEIIELLKEKFNQKPDSDQKEIRTGLNYEGLNKQELVELLEETVEEKDISIIKSKVGSINKVFHRLNKEEKESALKEFIATGGDKEAYNPTEDPLELRFRQAFNKYKHNKAKYAEELERQKVDNLKLKNEILEELKALIDSEETLKKTYDEFKRLQERWKEIGMVPAGELNNLWQNYHFLVELFFDKVRINKELRDLDLKKNLEQKIGLCEKAEELILEKSIIRSFKLLQQYHDEWREIGPVPSEQREELWERFKAATDKINERRKEHYKDIQEEQEKNYEAKVALCEKAEELIPQDELSLNEWQKKTTQINDLFKVWKSIGRASKSKNDEIWYRFKGSLDTFFKIKKEFLSKLKDQQMNNLNMKIDLCVQAEAIKDSDDWKKTSSDLIRLQKEWKNIGPVPRRQSDKVWKRFRSACDAFFNRKSEFFKNIHLVEDANLKAKKELIKEITDFKVSSDKSKNMDALKSMQRRWIEIGHVPFKDKDKIQLEYRKAIDALIEKMDINKNELSKTGFKNKVEMLKNDPDAEWRLRKERNFIMNKINKIKEDVALWENNIGFFASSKQSNALKEEFEKKIEKAKKEIQSFEDKIKILNDN